MGHVKRIWIATAAISLLIAAATCNAQSVRIVRTGNDGIGLLLNPGVIKELKLSDEQATKAKVLVESAQKEFQEFLTATLQDADHHAIPDALAKKRAEMDAEQAPKLKVLLTADQLKRLKQIELQQAGVPGITSDSSAKELALTDSQKDKLKDIEDEEQTQIHEFYASQGPGEEHNDGNGSVIVRRNVSINADGAKKLQALRDKSVVKALDVLTDEQKKKWKELTGEPFKLEVPAPKKA